MGKCLGIAALALGITACDQPPVVEILSPTDGTLIDDHAAIAIDVVVTEEELYAVDLYLDGQVVPTTLVTPIPENRDCSDGCALTLQWSGSEASEGAHLLTVVAQDDHSEGDAELGMTFEDTPTAILAMPNTPDMVGVSQIGVTVNVVDRSQVTAEMRIDGLTVQSTINGDCRFNCTVAHTWDTSTGTGEHVVEVTTTDPFGRAVTVGQNVFLGDIPYMTAIAVSGETDGPFDSRLEVEVHLEDAAGGHIGCAGANTGLEGVDDNQINYDVMATFVDQSGNRISFDTLAGRQIELHVMEDDTLPCPYAIDVGTDDIIGTSTAIPAEDLATLPPQMFGNVLNIEMTAGRPFTR